MCPAHASLFAPGAMDSPRVLRTCMHRRGCQIGGKSTAKTAVNACAYRFIEQSSEILAKVQDAKWRMASPFGVSVRPHPPAMDNRFLYHLAEHPLVGGQGTVQNVDGLEI